MYRTASHKSGEGTVVLKEREAGEYLVTVHKEALPPYYVKIHRSKADALADFERLTK